MIDLVIDCERMELSQTDLINNFDCGDQDLNDFLILRHFCTKTNV